MKPRLNGNETKLNRRSKVVAERWLKKGPRLRAKGGGIRSRLQRETIEVFSDYLRRCCNWCAENSSAVIRPSWFVSMSVNNGRLPILRMG